MNNQVLHEASIRIQQLPEKLLKKLNNTPADLDQFIEQLPTMQSMERTRQQLITQNRQLAMTNLKREPILLESRKKLARTMAELAPLREKYYVRTQRTDQESSSPDLILGRLQSLLHENERSNEAMVEAFFRACRNDQDVERFIRNFLHDRQRTIELRIIAEKFAHLYQIERQK